MAKKKETKQPARHNQSKKAGGEPIEHCVRLNFLKLQKQL